MTGSLLVLPPFPALLQWELWGLGPKFHYRRAAFRDLHRDCPQDLFLELTQGFLSTCATQCCKPTLQQLPAKFPLLLPLLLAVGCCECCGASPPTVGSPHAFQFPSSSVCLPFQFIRDSTAVARGDNVY